MKTINRDKIQRMIGQVASGGSGGYSSGGDSIITPSWLDENYVAIPYWENLFEAVGTKTTTVGSGTPTTVDYTFDANEKPETKTTTEGGVTTTVKTVVTGVKVKPHYLTGLLGINKTLYFDQVGTSYNVGIGVSAPDAKLHVNGNSKLWGNIAMHGAISGLTNINGLLYVENARVGIGVSYPSSKLHVSGNVTANNFIAGTDNGSYIKIGPIRIEYEENTHSLKVYNTTANTVANLYATGGISSLGIGSGGSVGGGSLADLSDVTLTNPSNGQILVYRNSHWVNEDMPTPGGGGTVTSVGMSVPTGLLVSNGSSQTITSAGTFALTLATGYEMFKPLDYFDASKNAKKANALNVAAAKKVWGQTYLNASGVPQDVTGNMTNVGDISFDTNGTRKIGSISNSALAIYAGFGYFFSTAPAVHVGNDNTHFIALHWSNFVDNVNTRGLYDYDGGWVCGFNGTNTYLLGGNVGVGLRAPTVKLHVDGGVLATKVYLYKPNAANDTGAVYLEYDSTKLGIHLVGAGIYTDSYVSALGVGSGGSGSSGTLHNLDDVDIDDNTLHSGQILVYRNTHWVNEDMPTPGGSGTVTSISAGTGLSSSTGGAITTTGTISISSTYQTYISDGETAYGWGNHATAGYLTGITDSMINNALGFTLSGTAGETYNLDAFLTSVAFDDLSSTPTTLSGYGITDAVADSTTWWGAQISNGAVSGPMTSVGNITLNNNSRISTGGGSTELYIGNSDNGGWVKLQDVCSASGYSNWAIYTDGHANLGDLTMNYEGIDGARFIYFGGNSFYIKKMNNRFVLSTNGTETINVYDDRFYCTTKIHTVVGLESEGYVTALSDIRHKDVCGTPKLTVEDIAQTQPILFTWKDKQKDQSMQAGAIAQEWQKILPEVVRENDGVLSLDYGVAALVSAMTIAKTVVNHEQRLTRLENELNKQKEL